MPFLFTTHLARAALRQVFPTNNPSLGAAKLNLSGSIVLRDLKLFDAGSPEQPLLVIREADADVSWPQLLSRKIRAVRVNDVTVYARSTASSQISLLDFLLRRRASGGAPVWVGTLDVQGKIRVEQIRGLSQAQAQWPWSFHMTTSGDRANPSRTLSIAIGDTRQLSANGPPKGAAETGGIFAMLAEIATQPIATGTRVEVHRIAASNAALTIAADALRNYVKLPHQFKGDVEAGLASLRMSGEIVVGGGATQKPMHGEIEFAGLHMRTPENSQLTLNVENISGAAKIEDLLPPLRGVSLTIERLQSAPVKVSIPANLIGQYLPANRQLMTGRIETGFQSLQVSGELNHSTGPDLGKLNGSIAFSGVHVMVPGRPRPLLSLGDLSGAAKLSTSLPLGSLTAVSIDWLKASNSQATADVDAIRQYIAKLPSDLHGPVDASLAALSVSGRVHSADRSAAGFSGDIRIQDLSVASAPSQAHSFAVDRLTVAASVQSRLGRWAPEVLKARNGLLKFASAMYHNSAVNDFDASWQIEDHRLSADHLIAKIFDGQVSGAPAFDLITYAMPPRDFHIESIDMHQVLANLSPERVDAEGKASGVAHLAKDINGALSGSLNLSFDGPGVLKIGQVEEVKQMLVGNFGLSMGNLAMRDLQRYPFKQGAISLESLGANSQLKIKFVRQPRTRADVTTPHKEVINGREVMVGSLVVPSIDMTIPITGKSLSDILSMASGVHPTLQAAGRQPAK